MTASREQIETFKFEIARLHHLPAQKQKANLVIKFEAKFFVPFPPALDRALGHFRVILVSAIGSSDCFADVGGGGKRMRQRARIDKRDLVPAFPQFDRGGNAVNAGSNYDDARCSHGALSPCSGS